MDCEEYYSYTYYIMNVTYEICIIDICCHICEIDVSDYIKKTYKYLEDYLNHPDNRMIANQPYRPIQKFDYINQILKNLEKPNCHPNNKIIVKQFLKKFNLI